MLNKQIVTAEQPHPKFPPCFCACHCWTTTPQISPLFLCLSLLNNHTPNFPFVFVPVFVEQPHPKFPPCFMPVIVEQPHPKFPLVCMPKSGQIGGILCVCFIAYMHACLSAPVNMPVAFNMVLVILNQLFFGQTLFGDCCTCDLDLDYAPRWPSLSIWCLMNVS